MAYFGYVILAILLVGVGSFILPLLVAMDRALDQEENYENNIEGPALRTETLQ